MSDDEELRRILPLAESVCDGEVVDWVEADGRAESRSERETIRELQVVSEIAKIHKEGFLDEANASGSWGPLRVLERVGQGAFGEVFLAWDPGLDREVALKLLRETGSSQRADLSSLVEEGRALAKVRHPNVVTVYGANRIGGTAGVWMEFVRGRSLEDLLRERGPFGAQEAALIGRSICSALASLHAVGLVHRDVKAKNVMREQGGRIVLMDLGAVRDTAEAGSPAGNVVSGTPLYMAPEVLLGHRATARSDIYCVGVLLFHLVTDDYPLHAPTVEQLLAKHRSGGRTLLRDIRPDLPTSFVEVVDRALEAEPRRRFGTAGEMEKALGPALEAGGGGASRTGTVSAPVRRMFLPIAAILLLATALAAAALLMPGLLRGRPHSGAQEAAAAAEYGVRAVMRRSTAEGEEALAPGARVGPGQRLFIEFEATRSLHVYVLNEDERGEAFLLFPLPVLDLKNPLPGGTLHRLPGSSGGDEVFWGVSSPGGREHFLVAASPEALTDLEREVQSLPRAAFSTSLLAARLSPSSALRLRGTGLLLPGLEGQPPPGRRDGVLGRVIRSLEPQQESVGGVWIREIELENPAIP